MITTGSIVSVRTFAKFGSCMSCFGMLKMGSAISVLDHVKLGSGISCRSFTKVGSIFSLWGMYWSKNSTKTHQNRKFVFTTFLPCFTTFLLENRTFYKLSTTFGSRRFFTPRHVVVWLWCFNYGSRTSR